MRSLFYHVLMKSHWIPCVTSSTTNGQKRKAEAGVGVGGEGGWMSDREDEGGWRGLKARGVHAREGPEGIEGYRQASVLPWPMEEALRQPGGPAAHGNC